MDLKQIFRQMIRILLPLTAGLLLLWYLYRNQDLSGILQVIKKGVRYDVILFSLFFGLAANTLRGLRWSLLIDALGKRVQRRRAVFAVWGNYAINMALPRVGEIWRCGVMAKYEKVPFSKLLGTLFVDRMMDTLVVALLTLCLCVFNIGFFRNFFTENPPLIIGTLYRLLSSGWTWTGLLLSVAACWFVFVKLKRLTVVQRITTVFGNIWEGFRSLWTIRHKARFVAQTFGIWVGYFLYFYLTFFAFDFMRDLGLRIALITFAMSSISVAVPVQGGIGVWHFMVIATLAAFGVERTDAGAFAMVVFAIQSAWVVLTGLFGIAALPFARKGGEGGGKCALTLQGESEIARRPRR
jgi:uncharacterized protein (TIRG00374 family)